MIKPLPSQEYLRQCFDYDPSMGALVWKARPSSHFSSAALCRSFNKSWAGKRAGAGRKNGYSAACINGVRYLLHRVVWKFHNGTEPPIIDHINHDPSCNRIENLRAVSCAENLRNRNPAKYTAEKQSGVVGVNWSKSGRGWLVRKWNGARLVQIGQRARLEDAIALLESHS